MSTVFISYPKEAQDDASKLAFTLEQKGLTTWVAAKDLSDDNTDWKSQIDSALTKAVAVVFLVYARREPSPWLQDEYRRALESYWSGNTKLLVPVLIGSNAEPPSFLRQWQSLRVQSSLDWGRAASQLAKWVEQEQAVRNKPTKKDKQELNRRLDKITEVAERWRSASGRTSHGRTASTGDKVVFRDSQTGEIRHSGKKSRASETKKRI